MRNGKEIGQCEWNQIFKNYRLALEKVKPLGINETIKAHCVAVHAEEYMTETGRTFHRTTDETCETIHGKVRRHEELHHFRIKSNLTSNHKKRKSEKSFNYYNAKRRKM